jgi:pseudouridine kinase
VTPQVVCVGGAVADRKYHLVGEPVSGTSNPARGTSAPGGVARNVAENLARLGVAVRLVSRVGDDDAGRALKRRLTAAGADVSHVTATRGFDTAEYVAVLDPEGDLVIGVAAMDVFTAISVSDIDRGLADGAEWLFLDCNLHPALLEHGVAYGAAGVRVAVDAVSTVKVTRLPGDLSGVDLLFCNADEARAYLTDPSGAAADDAGVAARILETGAGAVVLTRGPAGLVVADADGVREHEAVPADVVDVTGAGDALVGGTLAALLDGHDLDAAAAAGARLAALTVAVPETVRTDLGLVSVPGENQEEP